MTSKIVLKVFGCLYNAYDISVIINSCLDLDLPEKNHFKNWEKYPNGCGVLNKLNWPRGAAM